MNIMRKGVNSFFVSFIALILATPIAGVTSTFVLNESDISSNEILVIYDNNKASIENIHKKIAGSGHNTQIEFASDSIYNNLPECCLYKKKDKKKLLNH